MAPAATAADGRPVAKAVLVGDSGVGKTSLMVRFCQDLFHESTKATIGVDLQTRAVQLPSGGGTVQMQLWDTAGQEQFASLTSSFFRNAHAVVLAYDVHSPTSFASLSRWMVEVDRHAPAEVVKSVVGLKADGKLTYDSGSEQTTAVTEAEAAAFASKHGALVARCSSRDGGANVVRIFEALADKLVKRGFDAEGTKGAKQQSKGIKIAMGGKKKKKGCC